MRHADNSGSILQDCVSGVGRIVLNNPGKHNALSQQLWETIPSAVSDLVGLGARVIVVSGSGDSFCAGADISEFDVVRRDAGSAQVYEKANSDAFAALRNAPVPTLAKIRGYCLGGGFGLAAACDLRLASSEAQFSVPAARLGLAYPVEAMADIVNAVGAQMTKRLLYTADRLDAEAMHDAGFLIEITDELDARVDELADRIKSLAPLTHRATKVAIQAALGGDLDSANELGSQTFESADYEEGRAAFREKRQAQFKGR